MSNLTPVFECKLSPKDKTTGIIWLTVRAVTDDSDKLIDLLEKEFPQYQIEHIMGGYQSTDYPKTSTPSLDPQ